MTGNVASAVADRPAPSPPTHRTVLVMELLAQRPADALSLAQITRQTGLSRATAHAVLAQLTLDRWTTRDDAGGGYCLGPALMALARRSESAFPLRRLAADPLHDLATRLGVPAFLAEREGPTIAITDLVGSPSLSWIKVGRRIPFRPPVCREFIAWAPEAQQHRWISDAQPAVRGRLASVLDAVRARGFAVERLADDAAKVLDLLGSLRESPVTAGVRGRLGDVLAELITVDYLPDELGADIAVVTVAAPVFDARSRVIASLVACPDARLSESALQELGAQTVSAANRVTGMIADRPEAA